MSVYLYEFLYRGQPDGTGAFHVVLGAETTDAFGQVTRSQSQAMTPEQAAAAGVDLPAALSTINAATAAAATSAQAQVTSLQAQVGTLDTQLAAAATAATAAAAEIASLQSQVATLETNVASETSQIAALQGQLTTATAEVASLTSQVAALTPPPKQPGVVTFLEFKALFTPGENAAIVGAAETQPGLMMWLLEAAGAQQIVLSDPQVKAGLDAAVAAGLLTEAREAAIIAGTAPPA